MNISPTRSFATVLFTFVLFFTQSANAATTCPAGQYAPIASFGTISGCLDLMSYLNELFKTAIGMAGLLAVVMIVICGIRLMSTPSVAGRSQAKECIYNAIFGVLIAVGSWLLLNTINPQLLNNKLDLAVAISTEPPASPAGITPTDDPMPTQPAGMFYYRWRDTPNGNVIRNSVAFATIDVCNTSMKALKDAGATIENGPDGNPTCFRTAPATPPPATSGEDGTRNALCGNNSCLANTTSNSNVYINKPACDPYNADFRQCKQGTGTNVGGLPGGTVSDIRNLASSCGCKVVITGGTEAGHSSHGANIPVFDLSKTDTLYNFIKTNATVKDNPSFCTVGSGSCYKKWLYNGYWFTDESGGPNTAHWHVCKDGTVAPPGKPAGLYIKACTKV